MTPSTIATATKVVTLAMTISSRTLPTKRAASGDRGFSSSDTVSLMPDRSTEKLTIAAEENGQRLDRVLAARIPSQSRSRLKALIVDGQVTRGGRTIRDPAAHVNSGDVVTVALPTPEAPKPKGEKIPLNVVYEDDEIIVIDKPKGLVEI